MHFISEFLLVLIHFHNSFTLPLMFCCILLFPHIPDLAAPPSQALWESPVCFLAAPGSVLLMLCDPASGASVALGELQPVPTSVPHLFPCESTPAQLCLQGVSWPWHGPEPWFSMESSTGPSLPSPFLFSQLWVSLSQACVFTVSTN